MSVTTQKDSVDWSKKHNHSQTLQNFRDASIALKKAREAALEKERKIEQESVSS